VKKKLPILFIILSVSLTIVLCSCAASRYLGYRLNPDTTPIKCQTVIEIPGLPEQVEILLDEYGVPHIRAHSEYGLYFAFGYMQARDRRFELEALRNLALGRMREMIGSEDKSGVMKRLEIFSRMIGLHQDAANFVDSLSAKDRVVLQAFADGINAATEREPRPMEFRLLDYSPQPWSPKDSGAIIALTAFGLTKNWEMELLRLEVIVHQLQTGGTIARALDIYEPRYWFHPNLIGDPPKTDPFENIPIVAPELAAYLEATYKNKPGQSAQVIDEPWLPLDGFRHGMSASNNWAMNGAWTGTGKSALSMDPHMPHMLPSLGYLAHLSCAGCENGDFDVIGACFVGLPAISFGASGKTAWGPTSNWADITDLYIEKIAPGKPDHYLVGDKAVPFTVRSEVFKIRQPDGSFAEETFTVRETRHGVIVNDFIDRLPADFPLLALKRSREPGKPIDAIRRLYQADTVTQARLALNDFSAMVGHWALADRQGNIAYSGPAQLPRRSKHLGTVPVPGWVDDYEWTSFVPVDQLPYVENPAGVNFLGTANSQVVQPESTGYPINFEGNVPFRTVRIYDVLGRGSDGRPISTQIGALQMDNIDAGWLAVQQMFTPALTSLKTHPDRHVRRAAEMLLAWDGRSDGDSVAAGLYQTLQAYALKRAMEDEISEATMHFMLGYFNLEPLVFDLLTDASNPAWDDRRTPARETYNDELAAAFVDGVTAMKAVYGEDIAAWTWNRVAPTVIEHPFGSQKALADLVNRPVPTQGVNTTLFKHQSQRLQMHSFPVKYGPVLRIMVDLNDLPGSKMSLPGGQSGRPASPHFDDQLDLFLCGDGVSMEMDFRGIESRAAGSIVLTPSR